MGWGAPGLGKAPPARGPDPLARSAELSGRWRQPAACGPSSAAAAARDLLFRADAIRRFPVSVLAPRWRPRVQPEGCGRGGVGLAPLPVRLHRGGPASPACTDPRPSGSRLSLGLKKGVPEFRGRPCRPGPLPTGPTNSKDRPPPTPSSTAPSPHQLLTVPVLGQAWPSQLSCPLPLLPPLPAGLVPQGASGPGPVSTLPSAGGERAAPRPLPGQGLLSGWESVGLGCGQGPHREDASLFPPKGNFWHQGAGSAGRPQEVGCPHRPCPASLGSHTPGTGVDTARQVTSEGTECREVTL